MTRYTAFITEKDLKKLKVSFNVRQYAGNPEKYRKEFNRALKNYPRHLLPSLFTRKQQDPA